MKRIVIDTDPGTDDALALIMAVKAPDVDIQGLTTVGGNASLKHTTYNALRLMEYLGHPHMPVSKGAARPLRGKFGYAYAVHGDRGLPLRLPRPKAKPRPLKAYDHMISVGYSFPGEMTLLTLGPLTNVARALQREPRLREWIKEMVVMGGVMGVPGNVTPFAEFNIHSDPLAANRVFESGVPITLVGLDVCSQAYLTREDLPSLAGPSRGAKLAHRILSGWLEANPDSPRYYLCDPLAMAATLQPELLTTRQATVRVIEEGERAGQTVAHYGDGPVRVAEGVDGEGFLRLFRDLL